MATPTTSAPSGPRAQSTKAAGLARPELNRAKLPAYVLAVLEALSCENPNTLKLECLNEADWHRCLTFCDRRQLTLMLGHYCRPALPPWVVDRIDHNLSDYSTRFEGLKTDLSQFATLFEQRGIRYVLLKGPSHSPHLTPDPTMRVQGDIDVWCQTDQLMAARDVLLELGYRPMGVSEGRHLPPMIRPYHWKWTGNHFAPDMPVSVELHYRLWDEDFESIRMPAESGFWLRRTSASISGRQMPVLCKADLLGFAALHLLMHLLHGDAPLQRCWEIANFLHNHREEESFWLEWRRIHPPELRLLETTIFALAATWFGCALPPLIVDESTTLPDDVQLWLEHYALSPLESLFRPNKNEVLLQLALIEGWRAKSRIVCRRVLPLRHLNPSPLAVSGEEGVRGNFVRLGQQVSFAVSRTNHHVRALLPALYSLWSWWWRRTRLAPGFLHFQVASALITLGNYIFLLLYNLWLLDRGFREDVIGQVTGAMTAGLVAAIIPAAYFIRRYGLRNSILVAIFGSAAAMTLRTVGGGPPALMATGFLSGVFFSLWAVSFSPAIAGLTDERNRPFAFSLNCSIGMALGIVGGLAGGQLPLLMKHLNPSAGVMGTKRMGVMAGAGIIALAAIPASRLQFSRIVAAAESKIYPRGRFIVGFLAALFVWQLATGAFNPFFNVYFATRMHMSVERIGIVFSAAQLASVVMVLAAPAVLRRLGLVTGIVSMQVATGLWLASLALAHTAAVATLGYAAFMSFQVMSEPGILSMLMSRVNPNERSGASALWFFIYSAGGGLAAVLAGTAVPKYGYPAILVAAALLALFSALLFKLLVHESN
jgi:MFS family permease